MAKKVTVPTGYKVRDYSAEMPKGKDAKPPTKTVNPEFTIRGAAAKAIIDAGIGAGDTFEGMAKFKVTSKRESVRGNGNGPSMYSDEVDDGEGLISVELEIHSLQVEGASSKEDDSSKEQPAEDAIDEYIGSQGSAPEEED